MDGWVDMKGLAVENWTCALSYHFTVGRANHFKNWKWKNLSQRAKQAADSVDSEVQKASSYGRTHASAHTSRRWVSESARRLISFYRTIL